MIPETPVRVEYALTKKGHALAQAIDAIADWAHKWTEEDKPAPAQRGGSPDQADPAQRLSNASRAGRAGSRSSRARLRARTRPRDRRLPVATRQ